MGLAPTENHCLSLFLPACFPDALSVGMLDGAQSSLEARLFSSIERRPMASSCLPQSLQIQKKDLSCKHVCLLMEVHSEWVAKAPASWTKTVLTKYL